MNHHMQGGTQKTNYFMSLGHNSSCVTNYKSGLYGFEQERIDRFKSSSAPPIDAFLRCVAKTGKTAGTTAYLTHWFDDLHGLRFSKYFTEDHYNLLDSLGMRIVTHTPEFTHHDAHAQAGDNFFISHYDWANRIDQPWHILVADGFGNQQEVVSVYAKSNAAAKPTLVKRIYGHMNSLGLLYQYATAFCGMKENQDEYKFLGYESHVDEIFSESEVSTIEMMADSFVEELQGIGSYQKLESNSLINYESLLQARKYFYGVFSSVINELPGADSDTFKQRTAIGYFVQRVLEQRVCDYVSMFDMKNVIVSGGIFYNVKLNNTILNKIKGSICVYPVAGDQGAALGFAANDINDRYIDDLCIGERDLYYLGRSKTPTFIADDREHLGRMVAESVSNKVLTNVVTQKLEFGPRALGHTSSLFLPLQALVSYNNRLNDRNEVMPCAPMMRDDMVEHFFDPAEYSRVVGSDKYMVITYKYRDDVKFEDYSGVMHKIPKTMTFSGRPQIIGPDHHLYDALGEIHDRTGYKAIVNTSFNYHGQPIVCDASSVHMNQELIDANYQQICEAVSFDRPVTIIGRV